MTKQNLVVLGLVLWIAVFSATLGWTLHPDTKEVMFRCPTVTEKNGAVVSYLEPTEEDCQTHLIAAEVVERVVKEISVLAEQKECKEKGGKFKMVDQRLWDGDDRADQFISCTKSYTEGNKEIKETVFKYDLTN